MLGFVFLALVSSSVCLSLPEGLSAWFIRPMVSIEQPPTPAHSRADVSRRVGPFDVKLIGQSDNLEISGVDLTADGVRISRLSGQVSVKKIEVAIKRIVIDLPGTRIDTSPRIKTIDNFKVSLANRLPLFFSLPTETPLVVEPTVDSEGRSELLVRLVDRKVILDGFHRQIDSIFSNENFDQYFTPFASNTSGLDKEIFDYVISSNRAEILNQLRTSAVSSVDRPEFLATVERELTRSVRLLGVEWDGPTEVVLQRTWLPVSRVRQDQGLYGAVAAWRVARKDTKDQFVLSDIAPLRSLGKTNLVTIAASEPALESMLKLQADRYRWLSTLPREQESDSSERGVRGVRNILLASDSSEADGIQQSTDLLVEDQNTTAPRVEVDALSDPPSVRVGMRVAPLLDRLGGRTAQRKLMWFTFEIGQDLDLKLKSVEDEQREESAGLLSGSLAAGLAEQARYAVLKSVVRTELAKQLAWTSKTSIGTVRPFGIRAIKSADSTHGYLVVDLQVDGLLPN